jgi:UDP-2-acetamido-3-amino-2,3-dideoxy-glucuronate N-acetyltransferase
MTEKNIALIGAGYWGKNIVRNFHQLGVLKTICDQSGAIRQQMAKERPWSHTEIEYPVIAYTI